MKRRNVDLTKYKELNNFQNVVRVPKIYNNFIIRIKENGIYYFYSTIDKYNEIQEFFNKSVKERMSFISSYNFANMSEEQLNDFKLKTSIGTKIGFAKMNNEDKERLNKLKSENHKKFWETVDHSEMGNKISEGRNNMSNEDKLRFSQNLSNSLRNRSQEEKEKTSKLISEGRKEYFNNMTDKEHEEYSECRKRTWANKSNEEMKRISNIQHEIWENKTEEQIKFENKKRMLKLNKYYKDDDWKKQRNQKRRESNLEKYGVENPFQRQDVIEKSKQTKIEKYGTTVTVAHYRYNNIGFHSKEEVYFYIYHHNILKDDITRGKIFKYHVGDVPHDYECDFLVNGENVEIKGRQLINRETMILHTFPHKIPQLEKTQCLRDNNVRIIIDDDEEIIRISKIVEKQFPKLVASCRVKKNEIKDDDYEDKYDDYDITDTIFEM